MINKTYIKYIIKNKFMYSTDTNAHNNTIDLYSVQYDMDTLARNINSLNLLKIVRLQKLTIQFIHDYILNPDYQVTPEEQYINIDFVLQYQKHISRDDLLSA